MNVYRLQAEEDGSKERKRWAMVFEIVGGATYHIAVENEGDLLDWLKAIESIHKENPHSRSDLGQGKGKKQKNLLGFALRGGGKNKIAIGAPSRAPSDSDASGSSPSAPSVSAGPGGQRAAIIKEIFNTERDYLADLKVITGFYIMRLETFQIMGKSEKDAIFANVEELVPIHEDLVRDLAEETNSEDPCFAHIFISYVHRFTPYCNYCASQTNSVAEIARYRRENHNFAGCCDVRKK
jgi:hypothetical protein